jgi:hypothetical protein
LLNHYQTSHPNLESEEYLISEYETEEHALVAEKAREK